MWLKMVPTAGLEPAQIAPLAPQTSASTNFATSAFHGLRPTLTGFAARTPSINGAPRRKETLKPLYLTDYFGGVAGVGAGAGTGTAGAGAVSTERSNTLVGSPGARVPR
jgi:hypothetical protein